MLLVGQRCNTDHGSMVSLDTLFIIHGSTLFQHRLHHSTISISLLHLKYLNSNFGKLNYFLGKRAHDENRDSRYPDIDFCQDPGIICSSKEHKELKWIAGLFYWIESLQSYDERGWNYMNELHNFVDGGMADHLFIDAISGIVNRGCHDPPCGTGEVDGKHERAGNFQKVLSTLNA